MRMQLPPIILSRTSVFLKLIRPVAYLVMTRWLKSFAYRTEIGFVTFLFSGLAALVIAILTVFFQSTKAASANPVKSLRYE